MKALGATVLGIGIGMLGDRITPGWEWAVGFGMTLSKKIPEVIGARLRPWLDDWLAARSHFDALAKPCVL